MNYYAITFPNNTTLIYASPYTLGEITKCLVDIKGLKSRAGTIYNSRQYITVNEITNPDNTQKRVSMSLRNAAVY